MNSWPKQNPWRIGNEQKKRKRQRTNAKKKLETQKELGEEKKTNLFVVALVICFFSLRRRERRIDLVSCSNIQTNSSYNFFFSNQYSIYDFVMVWHKNVLHSKTQRADTSHYKSGRVQPSNIQNNFSWINTKIGKNKTLERGNESRTSLELETSAEWNRRRSWEAVDWRWSPDVCATMNGGVGVARTAVEFHFGSICKIREHPKRLRVTARWGRGWRFAPPRKSKMFNCSLNAARWESIQIRFVWFL